VGDAVVKLLTLGAESLLALSCVGTVNGVEHLGGVTVEGLS
jgi:hypothetical protein